MDVKSLMIAEDEKGVDRWEQSVGASDLFDLGGIVRRVRDGEGSNIESFAREIVLNLDDDDLDRFLKHFGLAVSKKRYGI